MKNAIIFIAIAIGAIYLLSSGVKKVQDDDDKYQSGEYAEQKQFDAYRASDSIGQDILDVREEGYARQLEAWNRSELKDEFLGLFPDFGEMKVFAQERIRGDALVEKLVSEVDDVEFKYFGGKMDTEQAKRKLRAIK